MLPGSWNETVGNLVGAVLGDRSTALRAGHSSTTTGARIGVVIAYHAVPRLIGVALADMACIGARAALDLAWLAVQIDAVVHTRSFELAARIFKSLTNEREIPPHLIAIAFLLIIR